MIARVLTLQLQLVTVLEEWDEEEAEDTRDRHGHITPNTVLEVDEAFPPRAVRVFGFVNPAIIVHFFILVLAQNPRILDFLTFKLRLESLRLDQLRFELLLQLFLNLLLEAEADFAVLLLDLLDEFFVLLPDQLGLNALVNSLFLALVHLLQRFLRQATNVGKDSADGIHVGFNCISSEIDRLLADV